MINALVVSVSIMDRKEKQERHFMDDLEHHTIKESAREMDEKLNSIHKKSKEHEK